MGNLARQRRRELVGSSPVTREEFRPLPPHTRRHHRGSALRLDAGTNSPGGAVPVFRPGDRCFDGRGGDTRLSSAGADPPDPDSPARGARDARRRGDSTQQEGRRLRNGLFTVWLGKFGKSRELPLHTSTLGALRAYLRQRDRLHPEPKAPSLFISTAGTRLLYCNAHWTFLRLVQQAGLVPRSSVCRPRIHDLRHSFAVRTVIDAYRSDADVAARLRCCPHTSDMSTRPTRTCTYQPRRNCSSWPDNASRGA